MKAERRTRTSGGTKRKRLEGTKKRFILEVVGAEHSSRGRERHGSSLMEGENSAKEKRRKEKYG